MGKGSSINYTFKFACTWNRDREGSLQMVTGKKMSALLLDTDKQRITLHVDLGCVENYYTYYRVVRPGRMYVPKSKYALNS